MAPFETAIPHHGPGTMASRGVNVIVFNDDDTEVLLQKRRDFRIRALPGGHLESGESREEADIRETFEETGYRIEVYRFAKGGSPVPFQKVQRVSIILGIVIRLLFRLRDAYNQAFRSR